MFRKLLLLFGMCTAVVQIGHAGSIGPADKLDALRLQLSQRYTFVVRFADNVEPTLKGLGIGQVLEPAKFLKLINGLATKLLVKHAFKIAAEPHVLQVWYLHPDLADLYVNTIAALDYNIRTLPLPNLVNLSIGPQTRFWRNSPDMDAPIHAATRASANAGLIPIIAIGNSGAAGGRSNGWINPWCYPVWVICVGAYDASKGKVAAFSSRGDPKDRESWPDVVAHGVDVIGPYPRHLKKSPERRQRDESNAQFQRVVPRDKWYLYTIESGTSQAAAATSGAAAQILHFLKKLAQTNGGTQTGQPLFSLTATHDRITHYDRAKQRLTGTAIEDANGSVVYEYVPDYPWKMVKQLLLDTAIPLPNEPAHVVGAGLVDRQNINRQFGRFGIANPKVVSSKVLRE